ncbi:hypothetical protein GOP47_0009379 [Adiantum capillus-veneris]|uniref:Peptidase A1 domain-containing protein n=1 Tax=Adiantum capillus-veneris TaxID=13818 RepID=A0A9D4UXE2_ADICA|nr:hypothetical protein GOP47_0009379 [Adiantum capillus-veneris]
MHGDSVFSPFDDTSKGPGDSTDWLTGLRQGQVGVYSGANYARSNHYLVRVTFGGSSTSRREFYLLMDTGSGFTWIQCEPCVECQPQIDMPIFVPNTSSTLQYVNILDVHCVDQLGDRYTSGGAPPFTLCPPYRRGYTGGAVISGQLVRDTLTLSSGDSLLSMPFGCTTAFQNAGTGGGFAGLLGLSRGPLGFPTQLQRRGYSESFSYCLPGVHTSDISTLTFNGPIPPDTAFTPLLTNPPIYKYSPYYYVELTGISVGGSLLPLREYVFDLNPDTGEGGFVIDSGAPITTLPRAAYVELRDAIRGAIFASSETQPRVYSSGLMDTCFLVKIAIETFHSMVPSVTLHFTEGADLEIPPQNLFIPRKHLQPQVCLYIHHSVSSPSVIGSMAQQRTRITFDPENQRVGFASYDC